jgi:hypothetical protein
LLKFVVEKTVPGMTVHWVNGQAVYTSSNYTLYMSRDDLATFQKIADLKAPRLFRIAGRFRLLAKALRLGVKDLRVLKSGTVLVIANKRIYRLRDGDLTEVHAFERGSGPLRQGWCEDGNGNCYVGEYFFNRQRDSAVNLLKSSDDGQSWGIIRSWPDIRHIHFVQYDRFTGGIWVGSGDTDAESRILVLDEDGGTVREVCSGDQMYRAVSLIFTETHVYWGSDSPTRQNYVFRYDRRTGEIDRLAEVNGPVYYSLETSDGIKLLATTNEGKSEGSSAEWDSKAHIWASRDGAHWEDIISWEKDFWPYLMGYGRIDFAYGDCGNYVYLTPLALKGIDGSLVKASVHVVDEA